MLGWQLRPPRILYIFLQPLTCLHTHMYTVCVTHTADDTACVSIGGDRSLVPQNDGCRLIHGSSYVSNTAVTTPSNSLLRKTCRETYNFLFLLPSSFFCFLFVFFLLQISSTLRISRKEIRQVSPHSPMKIWLRRG